MAAIVAHATSIQGAMRGRFAVAVLYAGAFWAAVPLRLSTARSVMVVHHLLACVSLDEGLVTNILSHRPMALRLATVGAPVAPAHGLFPRTQSLLGIASHAASAALMLRSVFFDEPGAALAGAGLFAIAGMLDVGLWHAARPSDILLFVVALALGGSQTACAASVLRLSGALYVKVPLAYYYHEQTHPSQVTAARAWRRSALTSRGGSSRSTSRSMAPSGTSSDGCTSTKPPARRAAGWRWTPLRR